MCHWSWGRAQPTWKVDLEDTWGEGFAKATFWTYEDALKPLREGRRLSELRRPRELNFCKIQALLPQQSESLRMLNSMTLQKNPSSCSRGRVIAWRRTATGKDSGWKALHSRGWDRKTCCPMALFREPYLLRRYKKRACLLTNGLIDDWWRDIVYLHPGIKW